MRQTGRHAAVEGRVGPFREASGADLAVGQIVENVERRGKSAVRTGVAIHSLVQMDVVCFNRRCATEQIPMLPLLYRQPIVRHGAMQPIENVPLGHQRATWIGQHLRNRWHDAPSCAC